MWPKKVPVSSEKKSNWTRKTSVLIQKVTRALWKSCSCLSWISPSWITYTIMILPMAKRGLAKTWDRGGDRALLGSRTGFAFDENAVTSLLRCGGFTVKRGQDPAPLHLPGQGHCCPRSPSLVQNARRDKADGGRRGVVERVVDGLGWRQ